MGITAPNRPTFTASDMKIAVIFSVILLIIAIILLTKIFTTKNTISKETKILLSILTIVLLLPLYFIISSTIDKAYEQNSDPKTEETLGITTDDLIISQSYSERYNVTHHIKALKTIDNLKIKITEYDKSGLKTQEKEFDIGTIYKGETKLATIYYQYTQSQWDKIDRFKIEIISGEVVENNTTQYIQFDY